MNFISITLSLSSRETLSPISKSSFAIYKKIHKANFINKL